MTVHVDTVFVWVTDMERSVAWYAGLGIAASQGYGDWQSMEVSGPTHFALHKGARPPGQSTAAIAFGVEDLTTEMTRLAGLGIEPVDENVTDTGVSRFTTYRDLDGNDIQLLERYG